MSRIDNLRSSRESYTVKFREFMKRFNKRPDAYVFFFEGQDSKYYSHRIEMLRPELEWDSIDSGGKENVLKLRELILRHEQYGRAKVLYFIDRDFDEQQDLPSDPCVYITPGYSVENLYVSESAFRRILKHEFRLSEYAEDEDEFSRCMAAFSKCLAAYLDCIAEINGWIMLVRRHEKTHPGSVKLNLKSLSVSKLLHIDLEAVSAHYTIEDLEKMTGAAISLTSADALATAATVPRSERPSKFRGKFQAYFLRVYLSKLIQDANSESPKLFSGRRHVSLSVSDNNLLSDLCQHADTPPCLRDFLSTIPPRQEPILTSRLQIDKVGA